VSAYGRLAEGGEPEDVMADRIPALQVALALLERDCAANVTGTMLKSTLIGWSALFKVCTVLQHLARKRSCTSCLCDAYACTLRLAVRSAVCVLCSTFAATDHCLTLRCHGVHTTQLPILLQYLVGDVVGAVAASREVITLFESTPGALRWM
jgi:hypothetical protein